MGIFSNIKERLFPSDTFPLGTPLILPEAIKKIAGNKKKGSEIIVKLMQDNDRLTKKDIGTWRNAMSKALDWQNPVRRDLYNTYDDILLDLHYSGVWAQRLNNILLKNIIVTDKKGVINEDASKLLNKQWVTKFLKIVMNSIEWGYTLTEFSAPVMIDGVFQFTDVQLVPVRHVLQEYGVILVNSYDDKSQGIDYTQGNIANWVIGVGESRDLGMLNKICPHSIGKKNAIAFWDEFAEIFGMPIRIGRTASRNGDDFEFIKENLEQMGSAAWGVFPTGTEIEFVENSSSDAFNVYSKRVELANKEISKEVVGQTLTSDSGGSYAQSRTHSETADSVKKADERFCLNVLNNQLIPFLILHGYNLAGMTIKFNEELNLNSEMEVDRFILDNFEVDDKFFDTMSKKYNAPIVGRKTQIAKPNEANNGLIKKKALIGSIEDCYSGHIHYEAYTPEQEDELRKIHNSAAKEIHNGNIAKNQVHLEMYKKIAALLLESLEKDFSNFQQGDAAFKFHMQNSVFAFSGAKSLTQLDAMRDLLYDDNDNLKSWSDYKADVIKVHKSYNINYLKAERAHAIASTQMATQWRQYEKNKDIFPSLEFQTSGDGRVRPLHELLDGVVRSIDDSFWDKHYPPLGWGCRCDIVQTDDDDTDGAEELGDQLNIKPMFAENVGKTGVVYSEKHPYYKSSPTKMEAVKHYGMKPAAKIYNNPSQLLTLKKDWTEVEYKKWLNNNKIIKDKMGNSLKNEGKGKYQTASNIQTALTKANEIYTLNNKITYILYSKGTPFIVQANFTTKNIEIDSWRKLDKINDVEGFRSGTLLLR